MLVIVFTVWQSFYLCNLKHACCKRV